MLSSPSLIVLQKGTWLPRDPSIHLLLATPKSSIPRDMSLDLAFNPHRVLLRITHPLKTIHIQGRSHSRPVARIISFRSSGYNSKNILFSQDNLNKRGTTSQGS